MEELFDSKAPLLASTLLILVLVSFIILFVIFYNKVQLKFELERQQFHQALLETEIEIREQTLSNVSQELHDNVGQIAALLKMNLRQVIALPESEQTLKESTDLLQTLIKDIKVVSSSLQNHQLSEIGLNEAIEKDCKRIKNLGFINIEMDCETEFIDLDVNTSIFLYRMYQEAINNVISHSKANEVSITLKQNKEGIQLNIKDNGIGFDKDSGGIGNGLTNLNKRAKTIGAKLQIISKENTGTEVIINFPLSSKHV